MTESTPAPALPGGDIHRLLDRAFIGVEMTADAQDLKEEVRANLVARVAELEAAGQTPGEAAQRAIQELGDVQELMDGTNAAAPSRASSPLDSLQRHRVRPKPAFLARVTIAGAMAAIGLGMAAMGALDILPLPLGVLITLLAWGSSAAGWIVGDSLGQETTTNHPMPQRRAGGYYLASALAVFGLGFAGLVLTLALPVWAFMFTVIALVLSTALFVFLGATQTNRHKAWVLALRRDHLTQQGNRFETDPDTAARFGIYTAVIWLTAFTVFLVLTFTIGWAWSWLALVAGFAVMLLVLARMQFGPRH